MRLDQFDKLQILVKELEDKARALKQENHRLKQDNLKLKSAMAVSGQAGNGNILEEIEQLKEENRLLKTKNSTARARLEQLIGKVEEDAAHLNGVK